MHNHIIPAFMLLAFSLPTTSLAAEMYHWVDSSGDMVMDSSGNCVTAIYHGASSQECNGIESTSDLKLSDPVPRDSDRDGVADDIDMCPQTNPGLSVDASGCALPGDMDNDGVIDTLDNCPSTAAGTPVDAMGCTADGDSDGVADNEDKCPGSPEGATVDSQGCAEKIIVQNLKFPSNSSLLGAEAKALLDTIAASILANPTVKRITVTGHTDSIGEASYNMWLSERRAKSVADYLIKQGINRGIISSKGMGESQPVATNMYKAGRLQNRRVEIDLK